MKLKLLTATISLLACIQTINAQDVTGYSSTYQTNFEDDWSFIEFDPPENNIWQVGKPSKPFLDSAYSGSFAIMTDTAKLIDTAYEHSFILKLERPWFGNCILEAGIQFYQKYSFDSLNSGGYINVSYDKGQNWYDINIDSVFYGNQTSVGNLYKNNDTIWNGLNGITSTANFTTGHSLFRTNWIISKENAANVYSTWIKFTYSSNGNCKAHDGWLIDDIYFIIYHWCEFLDIFNQTATNFESKAYPNPASNIITIAFENDYKTYKLSIFNIQGRLVKRLDNVDGDAIELDISNLPTGKYFYLMQNNSTYTHKGSFIKQ